MPDRQRCIECGKQSPETETNYTLISAQFGWRLSRRRTAAGDFVVEWRCPECWRKHKQKQTDEGALRASPFRQGFSKSSPPPPLSEPPFSPPSSEAVHATHASHGSHASHASQNTHGAHGASAPEPDPAPHPFRKRP